jgi:hypothetical protein
MEMRRIAPLGGVTRMRTMMRLPISPVRLQDQMGPFPQKPHRLLWVPFPSHLFRIRRRQKQPFHSPRSTRALQPIPRYLFPSPYDSSFSSLPCFLSPRWVYSRTRPDFSFPCFLVACQVLLYLSLFAVCLFSSPSSLYNSSYLSVSFPFTHF